MLSLLTFLVIRSLLIQRIPPCRFLYQVYYDIIKLPWPWFCLAWVKHLLSMVLGLQLSKWCIILRPCSDCNGELATSLTPTLTVLIVCKTAPITHPHWSPLLNTKPTCGTVGYTNYNAQATFPFTVQLLAQLCDWYRTLGVLEFPWIVEISSKGRDYQQYEKFGRCIPWSSQMRNRLHAIS